MRFSLCTPLIKSSKFLITALDCFTVDSAAVALLADTECIFSLYINSHENGTLRPVRYARAIGEPTPVPHIHLGAALPSSTAPNRG